MKRIEKEKKNTNKKKSLNLGNTFSPEIKSLWRENPTTNPIRFPSFPPLDVLT